MADRQYIPEAQRVGKGTRKIPVAELQERVLQYIGEGLSVRDAMAKVDRSADTYDQWRARFPDFANRVDRLRVRMKNQDTGTRDVGDFGLFRQKYLNYETFTHQWQWVDLLEGEEPRDLHESQTYLKGRPTRIILNTPPYHAKSATITVDYVVWRICADPNVKIILISESRDMARKMLVAIKDRLTLPNYSDLQEDFGPPGGFKAGSSGWTQDMIYVSGRSDGRKDPTVEVLGVASQIYGARADLIICDDIITLKTARTAGQRDKIIQWLDQEVSSRLDPKGKLLIVGTRVSPNDAYSALLKRDADKPDGRRVWTYFGQPAVREYADDPEEWDTLWPYLWDGPSLALRRDEVDTATWNLVYMQQQVSEDAVFPEEAVDKCRYMGNVGPLEERIRQGGMNGLYVVAGLDPAGAGYTAIVVLGIDKRTGVRYLLDAINQRGCTPLMLRHHVERVMTKYHPNEWRIEKNGIQTHITQDPTLRQMILSRGSKLVEHSTHGNKWDADYGVSSLAPLFLGALSVPPKPLIMIPDNGNHKGVKALIDQLVTWEPDTVGKTDLVMALWFADLGCRKVLEQGQGSNFMKNRWLTKGQLGKRQTVNLDDLAADMMEARYG